jgi:serine phosphatase RsbU (regulator of sigma subunit)/SAM-dependent methyltransferase
VDDETMSAGTADGHYLHGSEPEEQRRLSMLNDLLNEGSLRALDLRGDERVLDVGCGLGQLSHAMARQLTRGGRVVGIERDPEQLATAGRLAAERGEAGLVELRQGDAVDLPLADDEWGSFDVAHARFILEHVPDPQAVVAAMARAVRPGGRVVLEDDDHDLLRLWPEVPSFERLWRAYVRTYDRLGNDPYVGRRMTAMLYAAGAGPVRNDMLFFGSCAGNPAFAAMVANFVGLVEGAPEEILAGTTLTRDELETGLADFKRWSRLPDAAMWYATCWAEGRRAEGDSPPREDAPRRSSMRARAKVSSMELLVASAADLSSSLELDEVMRKIAARVQGMIDCHLFCVMLWNEETELLEHTYSVRYGEHVPQEGGFPLGSGLSGSAAKLRRAIRVPDVAKDPRYIRFRHAEVDIKSELAVPLVVRDRLVGALDLESTEYDAFSEEHEQIMTALASHIATALENARLYGRVVANERRLEEDLSTAREIQRGLLPATPPELAGLEIGAAFAAARELSGDFYDFLPLDEESVAVAVGDVAGKSTPAALYGSLAVGLLRGQALARRLEPGAVLDRLNELLWRLHIKRRFVAMSLAVIDGGSRRLRVANAGVPQPYLLHDGEVTNIDVSGLPLGGMETSRHEQQEVQLEPGDVVVFCSDGLDDCLNEDGETFGSVCLPDDLRRAADGSAAQIAASLIDACGGFAGATGPIDDDRTVVVVKATTHPGAIFRGGATTPGARTARNKYTGLVERDTRIQEGALPTRVAAVGTAPSFRALISARGETRGHRLRYLYQ